MPLTRLKNEYLEEDGVRFLMADEVGNTVTCRVSHEALRDHAGRLNVSGSDSTVFEAYRELIEDLASEAFDAEGPFDPHGRVLSLLKQPRGSREAPESGPLCNSVRKECAMQQVKAVCALCAAVISTTLILAAPASAGDNKFVFVHQLDSPGNDYSTVENSSFEDCAQKCDAQSQCNAFTYNELHSECFLKLSANRATTFYALAITGVKLSPSVQPTAGTSGSGASFVMLSQTDSPGNDYSQPKDLAVEECRSSCDADDGCHAFTYNLARGECFLKHAANQWTNFYAWGITGIKLLPLGQSPTPTEENQAEAPKAGSSGAPSVPPVSTPEEQQPNTTRTREPDLR